MSLHGQTDTFAESGRGNEAWLVWSCADERSEPDAESLNGAGHQPRTAEQSVRIAVNWPYRRFGPAFAGSSSLRFELGLTVVPLCPSTSLQPISRTGTGRAAPSAVQGKEHTSNTVEFLLILEPQGSSKNRKAATGVQSRPTVGLRSEWGADSRIVGSTRPGVPLGAGRRSALRAVTSKVGTKVATGPRLSEPVSGTECSGDRLVLSNPLLVLGKRGVACAEKQLRSSNYAESSPVFAVVRHCRREQHLAARCWITRQSRTSSDERRGTFNP